MPADRRPERPLEDRDRYRLLVDAIVDYAIYLLDVDGTITSWNRGAERFKGLTEAEAVGSHFSRFYTDADRDDGLPARALATAARDGKFEGTGWRVRKDGSRFWAHVVIDPVRTASGELIGFAKVTRDLTERIAVEDALRQSEARFQMLVESVVDYAIYLLDTDGLVSSWNVGAERIKGYRPDEIIGRHYQCFYEDDARGRGEPARALATAARDGRVEMEGWRVRKDGGRFWANVVIDAVRDPRGILVGFAKITRDVTERRDAQLALEKARETLLQSQKMEAIGRLTGGVAHDFNNLLMAVLGSLEMARRRLPDDARTLRLVDNAVRAAERGAVLTQRMLAFARRQELRPTSVDVPALVAGMADLLERTLGPSIAIDTTFAASLAPVLADAHQLELAVLNLAVNARDAMPDGGSITIAARAERVAPGDGDRLAPGDYVCLSMADDGGGMDEATLARALEPFFTTKAVGKGTGLGLSMVHGLAEQSNGRFVLSSVLGVGTVAEIWLPVAGAVAGDGANPMAASDAAVVRRVDPLVVVAVDDDPLVLVNTTAMLEDLGHTVLAAGSADDALRLIDGDDRIALVVTDHAMPRMTGVQLLRAVRQRRPALPFVVVTGSLELPADVGTDASYLQKPFTQAALADATATAVAGAAAAAKTAAAAAFAAAAATATATATATTTASASVSIATPAGAIATTSAAASLFASPD